MIPCRLRSQLGRADLVRLLVASRKDGFGFAAAAALMGFIPEAPEPPRRREEKPTVELRNAPPRQEKAPEPEIDYRTSPLPPARFFHLRRRELVAPEDQAAALRAPEWLADARLLAADVVEEPAARLPPCPPLAAWPRLWPLLRRVLGEWTWGHEPDVPGVLRCLGRGRPLRRLPLLWRRRWCRDISVLVDYAARTVPFHGDYNGLRETLRRLRGPLGLSFGVLESDPGATPWVRPQGRDSFPVPWSPPVAGQPLLILSDLGLYDPGGAAVAGWLAFGRRLAGLGLQPAVLCPVPAGRIPKALCRYYRIYTWDRNSPLRKPVPGYPRGQTPREVFDPPTRQAALRLLGLLAPALVAEPGDVRAVRALLPAGEATAAAEALLWRSETGSGPEPAGDEAVLDRIQAHAQGLYTRHLEALLALRRRFVAEPDPGLRLRVADLLRRRHARWPAAMRYAEFEDVDALLREAGHDPAAPGQDWLEPDQRDRFERWKRDIVRTLRERPDAEGLQAWLLADVERQSSAHAPAWRDNPQRAARWALSRRAEAETAAPLRLPEGVEPDAVLPFLQPPVNASGVMLHWAQRGARLIVRVAETAGDSGHSPDLPAALPIVPPDFPAAGSPLAVTVEVADSNRPVTWIVPLPEQEEIPAASLDDSVRSIRIDTGYEHLFIEPLTRAEFPWATQLRHDSDGLHLYGPDWRGRPLVLHWVPPGPGDEGSWQGEGEHTRFGVDGYGLYADLSILGVVQRFRWIAPGRFLMGSPDTEAGRNDDETPHWVTLTRGYWLADTACTQGLWRVLMGEYRSRDHRNPDEPMGNVSWNDAGHFLDKLNAVMEGVEARLPTEAEWEYACRAGTDAPLYFGGIVFPVTHSNAGNFLSSMGGIRLPNPWGLFDVLGRVREWCADWYGPYPQGEVVDPSGLAEGDNRVLRSVSSTDSGRNLRSAFRGSAPPHTHQKDIGFRLALGLRPAVEKAGFEKHPKP